MVHKRNVGEQPETAQDKVNVQLPIVGIGASAGGLDPITKLLENLPLQTGLSFVVIQHLASGQDSMLPEILSRSAKMKVQQAKENMRVEQDHIYVIPPGKTITLKNGCIKLLPKKSLFRPINDFLVSLASEQKTQAIGIVLSGTGNDGTEGLKAIKEQGGITFVQDPTTAQYPDMPKNAIAAGTPDFVLSPEKIAKELVRIATFPRVIRSEMKAPKQEKVETDLKKIIGLLKGSFGVDFAHYRETTINRRITRRMVINKTDNIESYLEYLRARPSEQEALFDDMLIGVTSFFREPETFSALKEKVLPEVTKNRSSNESLRIWIPGCSTGEEVYSLAMVVQEFLEEKNLTEIRVQIFGTDANEKNIEKARQGTYLRSIEDSVSEIRLKKFFSAENGHYRITKSIRESCIFAKQDITTDPPFSNIDLIMCRNVLIYFDEYLHHRVLSIFHYALKPNGFLVLGESESVGKLQTLFEPIIQKGLIYRKKQAVQQALFGEGTFIPHATTKAARPLGKKDMMTVLGDQVDHLIKTEYGPATFLVNSGLDILVFRGDVAPYLSPESGVASLNVTKIIRKELRSQVQTAVFRARKENRVFKDTVHYKQKGQSKTVIVEIRPLKTAEYDEPFYLVLFTEAISQNQPGLIESAVLPDEVEHLKDRQIRELKEDLEVTKESLQTLVEAQEATNEELRSSMEEVQSSNEELMSTNEELETAKEELQSGNEELQTLNEELKNRNQALGRLNDDLANLQTNIDLPVVIVDNNLKIRRFTASAQTLLNISSSDVGQSIANIKGVIFADLEKPIKEVVTKLTAVKQEVEGVGDNWYEMQVRPYLTEDKKVDGAVLSFMHMTERKRYEALLKTKERELSSIYRSVPEVLFFLSVEPDSRFRFISVSKSFLHVTGLREDQVVGKSVQEVIPEPSQTLVLAKYEMAIRERKTVRWEEVTDYPAGKKYGEVAVTPFFDSNGVCTNLVGTVHDTTERKKAESALRESEQRYRTLFSSMEEAFFLGEPILDKKGNPVDFRILEANGAFEKQTGLKIADLIGKSIKETLSGIEENWVQTYCKVAITGEAVHFEDYNKNTQRYYEVYSFSPVEGRFASLFVDITERVKTRAKLKEYSENLEKLVEERTQQLRDSERLAAIGTTAAMVGHDIRNPLQSIIGELYLARNAAASISQVDVKTNLSESIENIEKDIVYINKIVQDLQDFAKPIRADFRETDLTDVFYDLKKKNEIPKNITVSIRIDENAKSAVADPDLLKRVLSNLVSNAVQAMPEGGKLSIYSGKEASDVVITVQDSGVGIPEAVKGKLFTPLFTTKSKGQGFGLAVVKRMIEAMGGTVTFESQEGKGTKFVIHLPLPKN